MIFVTLLLCIYTNEANDIVALWRLTESSQAHSFFFSNIVPPGVFTKCVFDNGPFGDEGGSISLRSAQDSHVAIVNYEPLRIVDDFSIIAWVKIDAACDGPLFQWVHLYPSDPTANNYGANLRIKHQKLVFNFGLEGSYQMEIYHDKILDTERWIRVGITLNKECLHFIVDGELYFEKYDYHRPRDWNYGYERNKFAAAPNTADSIFIGASQDTKFRDPQGFKGNIFCLQLWKVFLATKDAIDAAFEHCKPLNNSGLVALWPLNYVNGLHNFSSNGLPRGSGRNVAFHVGLLGNPYGSIGLRGEENSYLEFTHPKLEINGSFTILTMMKLSSHHLGALFEWFPPSKERNRGAHLFIKGDSLLYNPGTPDPQTHSTSIKYSINQWEMVGITYNSANKEGYIYINGQFEKLADNVRVDPQTYNTVRIGVGSHIGKGGFLRANVFCVQLWNRFLTVDEIPLAFHKCVTCCAQLPSPPLTKKYKSPLLVTPKTVMGVIEPVGRTTKILRTSTMRSLPTAVVKYMLTTVIAKLPDATVKPELPVTTTPDATVKPNLPITTTPKMPPTLKSKLPITVIPTATKPKPLCNETGTQKPFVSDKVALTAVGAGGLVIGGVIGYLAFKFLPKLQERCTKKPDQWK